MNLTTSPKIAGMVEKDLGTGRYKVRLEEGCLDGNSLRNPNLSTPLIAPKTPSVLAESKDTTGRIMQRALRRVATEKPMLQELPTIGTKQALDSVRLGNLAPEELDREELR